MIHRSLTFHLLLLTACGDGGRGLAPAPVVEAVPVVEITEEPAPEELAEVSDALAPPATDEAPVALAAAPEPVPTATFSLRRGETLAHFARWSGLPIETVAAASGLRPADDHLPVGTVVALPIDDEARAIVEAKRDAHHLKRAEGYLESRGGAVGSEFYTVRTGDTATSIARDHAGIPVWLVETYNPAVDLERLRPGQELLLPVLGDTVAQGE